jgi:CheY-like chemotaxis protein
VANILLVEDDPVALEYITQSLKETPHRVTAYNDVQAALAHLERESVDLVLMDIVLPKVEGQIFYDRMRQLRSCEDVPVIVISGIGIPRAKEMMYMKGAFQFVEKRTPPQQLIEVIERSLTETRKKKK